MKRALVILAVISVLVTNVYAINYEAEFLTNIDGVEFTSPYAIAVDSEGRLFVSDIDRTVQKIYIFEKDGAVWHLIGNITSQAVVDMEFDDEGHLITAAHSRSEGYPVRVYQLAYDDAGNLSSADVIKMLTHQRDNRTLYNHIGAIAVEKIDGRYYYLITNNYVEINLRTVQVYDEDFNLLFQFDNENIYDANNNVIGNVTNGHSLGDSASILDLNVDANGKVIVIYKIGKIALYEVDYERHEVTLDVIIGDHGIEPGYFAEPRGAIHDSINNYLIVSDNLNHRIQAFDYSSLHDGINTPLFYFGSGIAGSEDRQLSNPRKIALHDNKLYVADNGNKRIGILTLDESIGNYVDEPHLETIEERQWYGFNNHREMFNTISRIAYTDMLNDGVEESIAVRTALNIPAEALGWVLEYIRTLPNNARLNIPWSTHLTSETVVSDEVVYNLGCSIGKVNATGVSDGSPYHAPPPQVGDALYCGALAITEYGSEATINMNNLRAYLIDPNGVMREAIWVDNTGFHTGVDISIPANQKFFMMAYTVQLDKEGEWRSIAIFSNATDSVTVEKSIYVGSSYEFNDLSTLEYALLNSGISEEDAINTVNVIEDYIEENSIALPDDGVLIVNATEGSVYGLACILPHTPPLSIGEQVDCIVFFLANPSESITIDDLHLYQVVNGISTPIQDWYWSSSIPNPFIWIETITMNEAGDWSINADFTEHGSVSISTIVSFNVVSETVIGAIALIGTALSILAYRYQRGKIIP
ncbi:MAG: hypothetical protein QXT32_06360 [Candidatus Nitrosocaldaceae archaeon]